MVVALLCWLGAAYAAYRFAWSLLAPDRCLDAGGSFDHAAWACSRVTAYPYEPVASYLVPGFCMFAGALALALVARAYAPRRGRS